MDKTSVKKSKTDLIKELDEKRLALRNIRFGVAGGKSKNVKEYGSIKKEIARMKTELTRLSDGQGIVN